MNVPIPPTNETLPVEPAVAPLPPASITRRGYWALSGLLGKAEFDELRTARCRDEADPDVLGEWAAQGP